MCHAACLGSTPDPGGRGKSHTGIGRHATVRARRRWNSPSAEELRPRGSLRPDPSASPRRSERPRCPSRRSRRGAPRARFRRLRSTCHAGYGIATAVDSGANARTTGLFVGTGPAQSCCPSRPVSTISASPFALAPQVIVILMPPSGMSEDCDSSSPLCRINVWPSMVHACPARTTLL